MYNTLAQVNKLISVELHKNFVFSLKEGYFFISAMMWPLLAEEAQNTQFCCTCQQMARIGVHLTLPTT